LVPIGHTCRGSFAWLVGGRRGRDEAAVRLVPAHFCGLRGACRQIVLADGSRRSCVIEAAFCRGEASR
jgi:hypothetical protein